METGLLCPRTEQLLSIISIFLNFNRKEFENHKIDHLVTVICRDVCKEGFGLSQVADAGITILFKSKAVLK